MSEIHTNIDGIATLLRVVSELSRLVETAGSDLATTRLSGWEDDSRLAVESATRCLLSRIDEIRLLLARTGQQIEEDLERARAVHSAQDPLGDS